MANRNTEVSLDALHVAIVADVRAAFPALQTVEFYRAERASLTVPACLLELSEFDGAPDVDPGTEQLAVVARFEARLVLGFKTLNAKLEARKLAAAFGAWLRLRKWTDTVNPGKKLPTEGAQVIGMYPDDFEPELDKFEVWRVEWTQTIHLGETVWKGEGILPTEVLLGWVPDVGDGHEGDYINAETGEAPTP